MLYLLCFGHFFNLKDFSSFVNKCKRWKSLVLNSINGLKFTDLQELFIIFSLKSDQSRVLSLDVNVNFVLLLRIITYLHTFSVEMRKVLLKIGDMTCVLLSITKLSFRVIFGLLRFKFLLKSRKVVIVELLLHFLYEKLCCVWG